MMVAVGLLLVTGVWDSVIADCCASGPPRFEPVI